MTLQDAINSGYPFRRPCYKEDSWVILKKIPSCPSPVYCFEGVNHAKPFGKDDMLATDFIIDEPKISVSEIELRNMIHSSLGGYEYVVTNKYNEEVDHLSVAEAIVYDIKNYFGK